MTPIVNGIKREYRRQIKVIFVSIDRPQGKELAKQYGVMGTPTILFFDSAGEKVDMLRGSFPPSLLEQSVKDLLAQ